MKKISSFEYNSLIWFVMRASYIGLSLSNIINITKQDSWLAGFIALILGLIPLFIFIYLKNYDRENNIAKITLNLFKKTGKLINIILIIGGLLFSLVAFSDLTFFVHSQFLFKTPHLIIGICFIIPIIYALFKGINTIAKTSLITFFFVIFVIICLIIGVFNGIDLNNLKPCFITKQTSLFHAAAIIIAYNVIPLFLLTIIPTNTINNYSNKKTILFYFLALLSLINAAFLTIAVFGPDLAALYQYPEFNLLKKFAVGDFIDRVENIFSLEWIIALIILIIIGLYFSKEIIKTTFKTKEKTNKIITFFVCLIILILNEKLFITNAEANHFYNGPMIIIMFFYLFLAIIITIKAMLKKHFPN